MITIIFGKPRAGKTLLMTYFLILEMFNKERMSKMRKELNMMNANGFNYSIPKHLVVTNYDVVGRKFGYTPRLSRQLNPFRIGYANYKVDTHFLEPYSVIGITEGQKYFNSRLSSYYPDWQSRWYEQHGHNGYDIYIDVQRPNLIDVNIRDISSFIEVRKATDLDGNKLEEGKPVNGIIWTIRRIDGTNELEKYFASGKQNKDYYKEETITCNYNVHNCYNSKMCKPKFYEGHLHHDFDTVEHKPLVETLEGYIKYLEEHDDELPTGFYSQKRSA